MVVWFSLWSCEFQTGCVVQFVVVWFSLWPCDWESQSGCVVLRVPKWLCAMCGIVCSKVVVWYCVFQSGCLVQFVVL